MTSVYKYYVNEKTKPWNSIAGSNTHIRTGNKRKYPHLIGRRTKCTQPSGKSNVLPCQCYVTEGRLSHASHISEFSFLWK